MQEHGHILPNPSGVFTIAEEGAIRFPPGVWGLDIDCECPTRGFTVKPGSRISASGSR